MPVKLPILPEHYGPWFTKIRGSELKQTNLFTFYRLGQGIENIRELQIGMTVPDLMLSLAATHKWLVAFMVQTENVPMPESREAARNLITYLNSFLIPPFASERKLTQPEIVSIFGARDRFEKEFEREQQNISVFTVLPKGIYNTQALIENPEFKFSEQIRKALPDQTIEDIRQAGKCLAFEIPTACAFHICRATESLMLRYYEVLTKHAWSIPQKDWGKYINELRRENAPEAITTRLDEIRKMDRNAYIHPQVNVSLEESPVLFDLCTGVIFQMGQEINRLTT